MKTSAIFRSGSPTLRTTLLQVAVAVHLLCSSATTANVAADIAGNSKYAADKRVIFQPPSYFERLERAFRHHVISEQEATDGRDFREKLLAFTRDYSAALSPTVLRDVVLGLAGDVEAAPQTYNVSRVCVRHLAATVNGWINKTHWATQMLDAMGKPVPAVSEGATHWLGAYDQCRRVRAVTNVTEQPQFSGQYCAAYVTLKSSKPQLRLDVGVCVPDSCSDMDMDYILGEIEYRENWAQKVSVYFVCASEADTLSTRAIVAIVILSVLLFCIIVGTAVDVAYRQVVAQDKKEAEKIRTSHITNKSLSVDISEIEPLVGRKAVAGSDREMGICSKILVTFSVYTNGSKLLSTSQPSGSLTCVHGIRFLSMTWVVMGHSFLFPQYVSNNMLEFGQTTISRWTFQAISNATFSVDSFFVLSGLLVSYLSLREMKKKSGRLNWFQFYFHRFWRLTPAYMLVIMVATCLYPYWTSGPYSPGPGGDPSVQACEDHWWSNLLYINNFVPTDSSKMCLGQSWYLANDMQFYVLSPLIIVPFYFGALWGTLSSAVFILATAIVPGVLESQQYFSPGSFAVVEGNHHSTENNFSYIYVKPWCRMGPYVIGLMAGYFLYRTDCKLVINKFVNLLLWAVATASALAVLYGLYDASNGHPMSIGVASLYAAVTRQVWGVCVAWVIIACCTGNGGFVNTILSWSGLVPLSRLTYCIYLLHILIMDVYVLNQRTPFYMSDVNIVMFYLGILVVSYMAAFVASLAFEAPMMGLEKLILRRDSPSQDQNQRKK